MREIGGYIELDTYNLAMLHDKAIALNCGRNALAYALKARKIKRIKLPLFLCDSVRNVCDREKVLVSYYHIGMGLKPVAIDLEEDEWLYLVNYYGQLSNETISEYVHEFRRVIVDQSQAYFQMPLNDTDTLYTCRKWFGVADGAFLYTNTVLDEELPVDVSYDRMRFLLGRYERCASEFYSEYRANNVFFAGEPIKKMSRLTQNLLHGIDYKKVEQTRSENFEYLHTRLKSINQLKVGSANFMYPLLVENGKEIRTKLQAEKIYIPTLWPDVFDLVKPEDTEYFLAENILPLPVDQRYNKEDMETVVQEVLKCLSSEK